MELLRKIYFQHLLSLTHFGHSAKIIGLKLCSLCLSYLSERLQLGHSSRTHVLHIPYTLSPPRANSFSFVGRPCGAVYRLHSETRVDKGDSGRSAESFSSLPTPSNIKKPHTAYTEKRHRLP
jgi:hypothetical protein